VHKTSRDKIHNNIQKMACNGLENNSYRVINLLMIPIEVVVKADKKNTFRIPHYEATGHEIIISSEIIE
jgi:hypothetical protein